MATYIGLAIIIAAQHELSWPFGQLFSSFWVFSAFGVFFLTPFLTLLLNLVGRRKLQLSAEAVVKTTLFCISLPFLVAFSQFKIVMRNFPGGNFDAEFAALDKWMHFGVDAWVAYAPALKFLTFADASTAYHILWAAPLMLGPALAISIDRNIQRRRGFWLTYLFAWVGLGNILAASFYSVGPVFYGPILNDPARYADLFVMLNDTDYAQTMFKFSVDFLLEQHLTGVSTAGAGISAFPSVHVAMATLTALYLGSLSRWLIPFGVAYALIIQIFAVLSGLHYAVDGYASAIAVLAFWLWVRKRVSG
ncbi:MAG: phosphatase PAP2 family protein [Pikeienuella sp.]